MTVRSVVRLACGSRAALAPSLLTAGLLSVAGIGSAAAQDATSLPQGTDSEVSEVVVTAQRRAENVQEVPKQISVATQATLENAGVSRINDLGNVFPSITTANNNQNQKPPGIRGIITFANATSVQAKTGVIVDDIPQPTFSTLATELSDIERVEIFPGPQATLSGRNAAGGIINLVTRAPSDVFAAEVRAEQTTDQQTRISGFITSPFSDTLAFSLSAVYNKWDGPVHNVFLGTDLGGFDTKVARGKLRWQPNDTLTATLTGYYLETDRRTTPILGGGPYIDVTPGTTHNADTQTPKRTIGQLSPGVTVSRDNNDVYGVIDGRASTEDRGASLRLDFDLGSAGVLSSLSNYQLSNQPREDYLYVWPLNNGSVLPSRATTDVDTNYWSQEVRLVSPGNKRFNYLLGVIYSDSDLFQPYSRPTYLNFDADRTSTIKSAALFGRGTYGLTDADYLTAGLRYQHDKIGYTWLSRISPFLPFYSASDSNYGFVAAEASYRHELTSDINAYASYTHSESGEAYDIEDTAGAAPPGSGAGATGPLEPLKSEVVDAYEVGLKSQFIDHRLTLNVSLFRADYEHYQVQTIDSTSTTGAPVFRILSIGAVRTQGLELSSSFRANEYVRLGLGALYNEAEIRDYPNAACYTRQPVGPAPGQCHVGTPNNQGNLAGKPLQAAPKLKLNANLDFTVPFGAMDVKLGTSWRHESKSIFTILQDPSTEQPAFDVVNLYVGVEDRDGRWSAQAYVNNVFDRVFYSNISNESQFNARSVLFDRNSFRYGGVRVSYRF